MSANGAIAVVATLFYLASQVRQSTKQSEAQGLQTAIMKYLDSFESATSSPGNADIFRRGLNNFDALVPEEQGSFHSVMHSLLTGFHNAWDLYEADLLPESDLTAMRGLYVSILMAPGGAQWWNVFKEVPPAYLVAYLDDAIRAANGTIQPANELFPWLRPDQ